MAKVHFAPNTAIKYVGSKSKEFSTSLARPKPMLKKGDIIIVDKRSAFNLVNKGFGEFVEVETIEFVKADTQTVEEIAQLKEKLSAFESQNNELFATNVALSLEMDSLKEEMQDKSEMVKES